jgi:hypothetical protein
MKCFDWVVLSCTIYMMNYNFVIYATYLLALMAYSELQLFDATQKLKLQG